MLVHTCNPSTWADNEIGTSLGRLYSGSLAPKHKQQTTPGQTLSLFFFRALSPHTAWLDPMWGGPGSLYPASSHSLFLSTLELIFSCLFSWNTLNLGPDTKLPKNWTMFPSSWVSPHATWHTVKSQGTGGISCVLEQLIRHFLLVQYV